MAGGAREHNYDALLATPLHIQQLQVATNLEPFMKYVEDAMNQDLDALLVNKQSDIKYHGYDVEPSSGERKTVNGISISNFDRKADKTRLFNLSKVKKSRRWIRNILLSDTSSEEDDEMPIEKKDLHFMLHMHKHKKKHQMKFYQDPDL